MSIVSFWVFSQYSKLCVDRDLHIHAYEMSCTYMHTKYSHTPTYSTYLCKYTFIHKLLCVCIYVVSKPFQSNLKLFIYSTLLKVWFISSGSFLNGHLKFHLWIYLFSLDYFQEDLTNELGLRLKSIFCQCIGGKAYLSKLLV